MSQDPSSPLPRAAVVYHPLKTEEAALRSAVTRYEAQAGWSQTTWYETAENDAGAGAAKQALASGANMVLASGGDGTIRAVAEALRGTGVPLAIIPQGTGNLLARNLGAPLNDIDDSVRAAFHGENRAIDLGVATIVRADRSEEEHVFLVLAGMGLDARTISATKSSLKKQLGWLAYVDAGLRTLVKESPLTIQYSVDGSQHRMLSVYTVMIGNCGYLPGDVMLIPDASVDDGVLDIVALRPVGPFSWLRIWQKIGWENGVLRRRRTRSHSIDLVNDSRHVTYLRARRFELSVPEAEPVQLDGDDFGEAVSVRGAVDPGALVVRTLPGWKPPY